MPLDWAITQSNLGGVLSALGGREAATERLEEAVGIYREALQEVTRERAPLDWAMMQNNLGGVLAMLGEHEAGIERLEEAVGAYREALQERTPDRVPVAWEETRVNLEQAQQAIRRRMGK